MHLEDLAKWRVEDLLHEARQARLLHQVPRQPWPLGAWLRKLALVRLAIDGAYADERLWPRLTRYPYGPPPQG